MGVARVTSRQIQTRAGVSSVEVLVSLGLLAVIMATTLPLFVRHSRLLVESRQERIAIEELANIAQRLASLDPAAAEAFLASPSLSALAVAALPKASLTVRVAESPLGRQATLGLSWSASGRRERPCELVVWLPQSAGVRTVRDASKDSSP